MICVLAASLLCSPTHLDETGDYVLSNKWDILMTTKYILLLNHA